MSSVNDESLEKLIEFDLDDEGIITTELPTDENIAEDILISEGV
nr:14991_t:CDS:2 [Entrophospora candida]